ncbi:MAG: cupin domain-containing protein [Pseudomonadota bacterium]
MDLKPAQSDLQAENALVRVTRWHLPAGSETGHHVHEYDYVIVPVVAGTLTIYDDAGAATEAPLVSGQSYFRNAGVSHNVTNQGDADIVFVEVELKPDQSPG